jgi:uncharacterized RDD family membrane protein YckC
MVIEALDLNKEKYKDSERTITLRLVTSPAAEPAQFLTRAGAFFIDIFAVSLISAFICFALFVFYQKTHLVNGWPSLGTRPRFAIEAFKNAVNLIIFMSYFPLCYWWTNGRTLGKKIFGIRVVSNKEAELSLRTSFIRSCAYQLSYLALGIGFMLPLFRADKRTLHDIISGTEVIKN